MVLQLFRIDNCLFVREFLLNGLGDNKFLYINKAGLDKEPEYQQVYDVDVIWDGGSYYLAYTESPGSSVIHVTHLDIVLPAKIQ